MGLIQLITSGDFEFSDVIIYLLSSFAVIFLTLPIHEFAHGFAASKLGDPTPRYQGRLTLNPLAHIDYIGAACIVLFGFGWAKPVGVNMQNFKNPKRDMAITAFAGPLSNILVAFVFIIFSTILGKFQFFGSVIAFYFYLFFNYIVQINIYLAVFNLLPIPPLDGSRLLSAFLPNRYYYKLMQYERFIFFGVLALIYLGVLDLPLSLAANGVESLLQWLVNIPFKLIGA